MALRSCGAAGAAREIFTRTGRLHDVDKINRRLFRLQLLARSRVADEAATAKHLNDVEGARAADAAMRVVDAGVVDLGHALSATAGLGLVDDAARAAAFRAHAPLLLGDAAALYVPVRAYVCVRRTWRQHWHIGGERLAVGLSHNSNVVPSVLDCWLSLVHWRAWLHCLHMCA